MYRIVAVLLAAAFYLPTGAAEAVSVPQIAKASFPAVVSIQTGRGQGSGFFVNGTGLLLTNRHVVQEEAKVTVTLYDGTQAKGEVLVKGDEDYALVQTSLEDTPYLKMGESARMEQGEEVLILGSPRGLPNTISRGIVSNPLREVDGTLYLQLDAALNQGNSGGPVLDTEGRVIGIATAVMMEAQGIGFVLPIERTFSGWQSEAGAQAKEKARADRAIGANRPLLPQPDKVPESYFIAAGGGLFSALFAAAIYAYRKRLRRDPKLKIVLKKNDDIDIDLH